MKALTVTVGLVGGAVILLGPLPPGILLAASILFGLALVWRLTASPLEVGHHPHPTWFDGARSAPLVVRGAVRAGERSSRR